MIHSLAFESGDATKSALDKALQRLQKEKQNEASINGYPSKFSFEIIDGPESVRINLYNATHVDIFWLGSHFRDEFKL